MHRLDIFNENLLSQISGQFLVGCGISFTGQSYDVVSSDADATYRHKGLDKSTNMKAVGSSLLTGRELSTLLMHTTRSIWLFIDDGPVLKPVQIIKTSRCYLLNAGQHGPKRDFRCNLHFGCDIHVAPPRSFAKHGVLDTSIHTPRGPPKPSSARASRSRSAP